VSARRDPQPWSVDWPNRFVSLWRTRGLDATLERFRMQDVVLPPLDLLPPTYAPQLGAVVRRTHETVHGVRADYVSTGPDDFAHAELYVLVARELAFLGQGMRVLALNKPRSLTAELEQDGAFEPVNLSDYDIEPTYRPGFED
jgi:hypothetical protein